MAQITCCWFIFGSVLFDRTSAISLGETESENVTDQRTNLSYYALNGNSGQAPKVRAGSGYKTNNCSVSALCLC